MLRRCLSSLGQNQLQPASAGKASSLLQVKALWPLRHQIQTVSSHMLAGNLFKRIMHPSMKVTADRENCSQQMRGLHVNER